MRKPKVKLNSESHYSFRIQEHSQKYYDKLWSTPADNDADTIFVIRLLNTINYKMGEGTEFNPYIVSE